MGANRLGTLNKDAFTGMMLLNELYVVGDLVLGIRDRLLANSVVKLLSPFSHSREQLCSSAISLLS